jgi:hypothetical protein
MLLSLAAMRVKGNIKIIKPYLSRLFICLSLIVNCTAQSVKENVRNKEVNL